MRLRDSESLLFLKGGNIVAIALTKSTWFIVGWVAQILGILMNGRDSQN